MRPRFPLYLKIFAWFTLNLVLLLVAAFFLMRWILGIGPEAMLQGDSGARIQGAVEIINAELRDAGPEDWQTELERFSTVYGVEFSLYRSDGRYIRGPAKSLPSAVQDEVLKHSMHSMIGPERRGPSGPGSRELRPRQGPRGDGPGPGGPGVGQPKILFLIKSTHPKQYWLGARVSIGEQRPDRGDPPRENSGPPRRGADNAPPDILIARMDRLSGNELMPNFRPWILAALLAVGLSALFWIPFVRSITHSLRHMRDTTEEIAAGHFDVDVEESRSDELGQLGRSINHMSGRLAGYVNGQRRFLGDIAHELCSPIARMQLELGVLEQDASPATSRRIDSVRDELEHMADMVNELLSFSKASLQPDDIKPERVNLPDLIREVAERETGGRDADIGLEETSGLAVMADRKLLNRALGNLVRNSMRYAGEDGSISIDAAPAHDGLIAIKVRDHGPGIPEKELQHILDPFYRPDEARTRERGGAGLGLAIVKTCIEACGGKIRCANADPGFEVTILLPMAPS